MYKKFITNIITALLLTGCASTGNHSIGFAGVVKHAKPTPKTNEVDILPALKGADSCCQTLMSERENVLGGINISIMQRPTLRA